MDKDFLDTLESITEWKKVDDKSGLSEYSISFSNEEDGLVRIESAKGNFMYKLKPLHELFSQKSSTVAQIDWEDQHFLSLLYTIERAIKKFYKDHYTLTDSDVIPALETLAMKPEAVSKNSIVRAINQELRLHLSMNSYSRHEVKMAVRKVLSSAKGHNKQGGLTGYLDIIMQYVP